MKTVSHARLKSTRGSTLVTVMFFVTVLAVMVGSLLEMVLQEFKLSKRSLAWNQALYSGEAGIEKGWNEMNRLTSINTNGSFMSGWTPISPPSSNTWTLADQTLPPLGGNEAASSYTVWVTTNSPSGGVTIIATGSASSPLFSTNVARNVKAVLRPVTPFNFAILSKQTVDFNGQSATVDSWIGDNGAYSSSAYSAGLPNGRRAHGNIGTDGLVNNTAGLTMRGSPSTGPGGTWTGSAPVQPVLPDIGTNYWTADTQVPIPDATLPRIPSFSSSPTPVSANTSITAAGDYVMAAATTGPGRGNSIFNDVTFGDAAGAGGVIRIHLTGGIDLGGSNTIKIIQPSGGGTYRVELYVDGPSINFAGTEDANGTAGAKSVNLQIYGLPTVTSVNFNGNCETHAAVYAPNANITVNGGGNKAFYGSMVGKTFLANGGIDIHYDESLANQGTIIGYKMAQWSEF